MTQYKAFLADILEHPEDDTPRLILADWWDENDQSERAEFCRVQCELAMTDLIPPDDLSQGQWRLLGARCDALRRRERALLLAHGFDWLPKVGIKPILHDGGGSEGVNFEIITGTEKGSGIQCDFRRGFVEQVTCAAADWLAHGDAIRRAQPVTRVRLTTLPEWGDPAFETPMFAGTKDMPGDEARQTILGRRWPGVVFEVPRANPRPQTANYDPG